MSYGSWDKDNLADDIKRYLKNYSVHELLELISWIIQDMNTKEIEL